MHLLKFRFLAKKLKNQGLLSKKLEFDYVQTESWFGQSARDWVYGLVALVKELISYRKKVEPAVPR